jgi:hypothetical protein
MTVTSMSFAQSGRARLLKAATCEFILLRDCTKGPRKPRSLMDEEQSVKSSRDRALEVAILGPLERAAAQGTDPLTLLDIEDALRSARVSSILRELVAPR